MFSGVKNHIVMAAAMLLAALPLRAAVQVTDGRILLGSSFLFPAESPAEFECRISNPDPRPHRVMIRLSPVGYTGSNSNSPEMVIPARTVMIRRFPIFPGTDEKFTYTVFEDGIRRPGSTLNECIVKYSDIRTGMVGILNDFGFPPGGLKQNRFLDRSMSSVSFRAGSLPKHSELYRSLAALIVVEPDFSKYSSEQYSAILEYAASGGLVVFADPAGTLAAASTPLAELLGVVPLGIRKLPNDVFRKTRKKSRPVNPFEIQFLDSAEKPGGKTEYLAEGPGTGFPLFHENRYGHGMVRFLAFAPVQENFPGDSETPDSYTARLLNIPSAERSQVFFRAPLDRLTGFAVPHTRTVRNILILYFAVLLAILILGFRRNRHIGAWAAGTLAAVLFTAAILFYVKRTIGKRGAVAAVLQVANAQLPGSGRNYISLYAPAALKTTVSSGSPRNLFERLPFRRYFSTMNHGLDNLNAAPLDLRMQEDDTMLIREINLAARSSRQMMEHLSPPVLAGSSAAWKTPRLLLSANGLALERWKIPDHKRAEAVFVLFPNGSKAAEISPDGFCTMKSHDSAIADPLIKDIRTAMERSHAKKYPAVAVVSNMIKPHAGLDPVFVQQGKTVTVYPADLAVVSESFMIPAELMELTPSEIGSRAALEGGRINTTHSFQSEMSVTIRLNRSASVDFPAEFSSLRAKVTISGTGKVEPILKLSTGSGRSVRLISGKKIAFGEYLFSGDEFKKAASGRKVLQLVIEGVQKKDKRKEADLSVETWSLLDLQLEMRGKTGTANKENDGK